MLKIAIDTDVVVAALRCVNGGGNALLREVALGRLVPLVTPALFLEYETVLKRAEQRLVHGLGLEAIDRFLAGLASACQTGSAVYRIAFGDRAGQKVLTMKGAPLADGKIKKQARVPTWTALACMQRYAARPTSARRRRGDVALGVYAKAGCLGAKTEAAFDSIWCVHRLRPAHIGWAKLLKRVFNRDPRTLPKLRTVVQS